MLHDVCESNYHLGYNCSRIIQTGNSKTFFDKLVKCNVDDSQYIWSKPWHPAVKISDNTCSGYFSVPTLINCTINETIFPEYSTVKHQIQRVCDCRRERKYFSF